MRLQLRLPARSSSLSELRVALAKWLAAAGVKGERAFDVIAAASEAASNAIEHAEEPTAPVIELEADRTEDAIVLRVRDHGRWREPRLDSGRNRGLLLINGLVTDLDVDRTPAGTVVTMRLDLGAARPAV